MTITSVRRADGSVIAYEVIDNGAVSHVIYEELPDHRKPLSMWSRAHRRAFVIGSILQARSRRR